MKTNWNIAFYWLICAFLAMCFFACIYFELIFESLLYMCSLAIITIEKQLI